MYAIVDIAGQQFRVEKDQKVFVHKLEGEAGSKVDLDKVLLIGDNDKVNVGSPVIDGAMVHATIIDHQKGDKVIVFKKKRKKGYRVKKGHRQSFTQILIEDIIESGAKARATKEPKKTARKAPAREAAEPVEGEAAPILQVAVTKKATVKKAAAKKDIAKPAAKKAAPKKSSAKGE
jgi:large subunit ribosomal protein L21